MEKFKIFICFTKLNIYCLISSTNAKNDIVKKLLKSHNRNLKYILTAKFQSDMLKQHQCKQMSGCNYYIPFQKILKPEKKLRL